MNFPPTTGNTRCSLAAALMFASVFASSLGTPAIAQTQASEPSDTSVLDTSVEIPAETMNPIEAPVQDALTELGAPKASESETGGTEISTANYTDEKLSVDYPASWQLKTLEDGIIISSVATTPAELIATQIVRIAASPGAVVNANIESFDEEGSAVARYSRATIDGQDALVMWLSDRPDELGSAIATFIGYDSETVLLFSRYAPENTAAEAEIIQIHTSFTDPAAPEDSAAEADPTAVPTEANLPEEAKPSEASEAVEIVPATDASDE